MTERGVTQISFEPTVPTLPLVQENEPERLSFAPIWATTPLKVHLSLPETSRIEIAEPLWVIV